MTLDLLARMAYYYIRKVWAVCIARIRGEFGVAPPQKRSFMVEMSTCTQEIPGSFVESNRNRAKILDILTLS